MPVDEGCQVRVAGLQEACLPCAPAGALRDCVTTPLRMPPPLPTCAQVLLSLPSFVADLRHGRAALEAAGQPLAPSGVYSALLECAAARERGFERCVQHRAACRPCQQARSVCWPACLWGPCTGVISRLKMWAAQQPVPPGCVLTVGYTPCLDGLLQLPHPCQPEASAGRRLLRLPRHPAAGKGLCMQWQQLLRTYRYATVSPEPLEAP